MALRRVTNNSFRVFVGFGNKNIWWSIADRKSVSCSSATFAGEGPALGGTTSADDFRGPVQLYESLVSSSDLTYDSYQRKVLGELQRLHEDLVGYVPSPPKTPGFFSKILGKGKTEVLTNTHAPRGLYLYGSVGCGKTMLMDLFYHTCHLKNKQRIHFHAFMLDIHKRIHEQKKIMPRVYSRGEQHAYDPIPPVAKTIAENTILLCFDEFQVTDIADAMILKRLFSHLWLNGVVTIATSNRPPDDLYKNGLQRINFLPFIPLVKEYSYVFNLDSGIDYRRITMPSEGTVFYVKTAENDCKYELDQTYEELASEQHSTEEGTRMLKIMGRKLFLPKTCGRLLDSTFHDLCNKALGAADYLELTRHFDTIILRDIPHLNLERKAEARRFITLIDTIYDNKVRLVCSASAPVDGLFATGQLTDEDKHYKRVLMGDLNIQLGSDNEEASLFTGEEELFAFERVRSRLTEMQSQAYWDQREEFLKTRQHKPHYKKKKASSS